MRNLSNLSRPILEALAEASARGLDVSHLVAKDTVTQSQLFSTRYFSDYRGFLLDCVIWRDGEEPSSYQLEMAQSLITHKKICVRGPHGLGKTAYNALSILWFALTRDLGGYEWKVPTTAGAWRQLSKFLWPEVHKWSKRLKWEVIGRPPFHLLRELQALSLKLENGEAFASASDNSDLIEGAHAEQLLYVFDESKSIMETTFDSAEGAFSNAGANSRTDAFAISVSTPGEPLGRFFAIQQKVTGYEDWWVRHVTFAEVVSAGRATWKWAKQRAAQWGEDSALYKNRVLGEFASTDDQGVIPLSWVEAANERWLNYYDVVLPARNAAIPYVDPSAGHLSAIGVDVGDGGDETVVAYRDEDVLVKLEKRPKGLMETVGKVVTVAEGKGKVRLVVDAIGVGAGVVSRLNEVKAEAGKEYLVVAFNAAEGEGGKDEGGKIGFLNKRAGAWWNMRALLDPRSQRSICLPPDDKLIGDLVSPHYKVVSGGKYQIESKADIKKRLHRSTDSGDAVIMAFYEGNTPLTSVLDFYNLSLKRKADKKAKERTGEGVPKWG